MTKDSLYTTAIGIRNLACVGFLLTAPIASAIAGSAHDAVALDVASRQCYSSFSAPKSVTELAKDLAAEGLPVWSGAPHRNCMVTWALLGQIGGARLFRGRYAWPSNEIPSLKVVTEVLFQARAASARLNPVFAARDDQENVYVQPLTLHSVSGRTLIEVLECINGTAGCDEAFLEYKAGKVSVIANTVQEQVQQKLPDHLQQWKAPHIDIDKLTGEAGGWREHDSNCCPSFDVSFKLELLGNALHVKSLSIQRSKD